MTNDPQQLIGQIYRGAAWLAFVVLVWTGYSLVERNLGPRGNPVANVPAAALQAVARPPQRTANQRETSPPAYQPVSWQGPPEADQADADVSQLPAFLKRPVQRFLAPSPTPQANPPQANSTQANSTQANIPVGGQREEGRELVVQNQNGRVTLNISNAPVKEVLSLLARSQKLNLVCGDGVQGSVSVTLEQVTIETALNAVLAIGGYTWTNHQGIIHVSAIANSKQIAPSLQGREVRVFELNFASAGDVNKAVKGLLSSLGQSFISESATTDNRRTMEVLVVEDLPAYMARIAQLVRDMDRPPRQVLIEAHLLQIKLENDDRHGVNLNQLLRIRNTTISSRTVGFANAAAPQAYFLQLTGTDLNGLLEMLRSSTNTKTLASPRILALNGQTARIQIGQQLGFRVTTTTETSTLESVDFINVGVVLQVTPRISRSGQVMMRVEPKVSSGQVNPDTGLPEEETTEVLTDVMLNDGQAIVLGGLIQEEDTTQDSRIAYLGDLPWLGGLFRRTVKTKTRNEIVIALVPRILPYNDMDQQRNLEDMNLSRSQLFCPPEVDLCYPAEAQLQRRTPPPRSDNQGGLRPPFFRGGGPAGYENMPALPPQNGPAVNRNMPDLPPQNGPAADRDRPDVPPQNEPHVPAEQLLPRKSDSSFFVPRYPDTHFARPFSPPPEFRR